jgi:hypothetical protein
MSAASPRADEWHIKGVSPETRRKIKIFAVSRGLTLAEALDRLVELAVIADDVGNQKQSGTDGADKRVSELETAFPKDFGR